MPVSPAWPQGRNQRTCQCLWGTSSHHQEFFIIMIVKFFEKSVSPKIPPQKDSSFHVWSMGILPEKRLNEFPKPFNRKDLELTDQDAFLYLCIEDQNLQACLWSVCGHFKDINRSSSFPKCWHVTLYCFKKNSILLSFCYEENSKDWFICIELLDTIPSTVVEKNYFFQNNTLDK